MSIKMLKIYISEEARYKGKTLYRAIVRKLHDLKMAGVTVTRGIEGYGSDNILHTTSILDLSASLPIIIDVIDEEEKITDIIPVIKEMVTKGRIILVDINVIQ